MDDLYWCGEGCGFVDKDHWCEQWCHIYRIPGEAIARIRAEARAEALKEAAEKAALDENWLARWFSSKKREHNVMMGLDPLPSFGSPIPPAHYFANFMGREIKKLIDEHFSAILAEEPKEEREAGLSGGRTMQMPDCQRGIYCLESDDDKCRFPEDGCLRLMHRARVERAILADEPKEEREAEGLWHTEPPSKEGFYLVEVNAKFSSPSPWYETAFYRKRDGWSLPEPSKGSEVLAWMEIPRRAEVERRIEEAGRC